jgi:hypothetical protein
MMLFQIIVDIWEPGNPFPIVTHLFRGATPEDAEAIHQAHRRSDKFLRQCEDKSMFAGNVPCTTKIQRGWITF